MKNLILYNPLSDNGRGREDAEAVRGFVAGECEFVDVTRIPELNAYLEAVPQEDRVVLCGGDGTVHVFAQAVTHPCREIYYFPCGSGNDFWMDLERGEDKTPILLNPYLRDLPIATVKGREYRVVNGVGFGIDGYCCEEGDRQRASSDKPINYTAIAIKGLLGRFKPRNATVTVDGVEHTFRKVWLAPTMHGRCYGGGMIPTPAQVRNHEDGTLSTLVFCGSGKLRTLLIFPSIFKGEHVRHKKHCRVLTGREITVRFDEPCALQVDGETVLDVTEYSIRSVRSGNA